MRNIYLFILACLLSATYSFSQTDKDSLMREKTFSGLKFRNIGPALTSGRIADIAIHPDNQNIVYVAVGSGNVWKTVNAGTTWKPIFENYGSYSTGCITLDPSNPHIVWLGTGENVGGRHVGFGDGVYKSMDGGNSWENVGLKSSEHISKILIHPDNSDIVWVAAQGPLWSKGGERGLYKTMDGGKTWKKTLGDAEWVGVTDIVMDPGDPNKLYAATWQRHRTVASYLGGGPGSGIHMSSDGGETWKKLSDGIPKSNLGKIGLAISPFNSDWIYAAIELDRTNGGLFISKDRGRSWSKQSDMVSGGTGPHYYQELYADPHHEGRIYLMNNNVLISDDHGKTYYRMNEDRKHVDTHAMAFRSNDPDYVIMGTDGGLYESFDLCETWTYTKNLPVTQFYKVAVDDAEPFYNVYGGTQDNGSQGGPSRTMWSSGIHNRDWRVVLGADGHQSATEPGNPNITYGEYQQGVLFRIDHLTGEQVFIQPQPGEGDPYERFNWDAPILVSPFSPQRLYFASYRLWRSDNRGDEWTAVSGDLTRNQERFSLPIMGKNQSWDNPWDVGAMSTYNTITSISESPKMEGLLYVGTDDGIIQVSEDGGSNWRKIETGSISGVPATAFVNDIRADLFDVNTVYAALDNHKYGDYKPYLLKSVDKGKSWRLITGDLPAKLLVWRLVQDHVKKDLLFTATEFGIYFTIDGGAKWIKLTGGVPTISFRDITIQRRENDLVGASFGRGFFIMDDYSPLREMDINTLQQEAVLFDTRRAFWYNEIDGLYGQGHSEYTADNPTYGATFTYYLKDEIQSLKDIRQEKEKELSKQNKSIPFPGWEALEKETRQVLPGIYLTIKDKEGKIVNQIKGSNSKGINRVAWDLSLASKDVVRLQSPRREDILTGENRFRATPGTYSVTLSRLIDGQWIQLVEPKEFEVVPLKEGAIKGASYEEMIAFRERFNTFQQEMSIVRIDLTKSMQKVSALEQALSRAEIQPVELIEQLYKTRENLALIDRSVNGYESKNEVGERNALSPRSGLSMGNSALNTTYGPTQNHIKAFERSVKQLAAVKADLDGIMNDVIPGLEKAVSETGAPMIEGQR